MVGGENEVTNDGPDRWEPKFDEKDKKDDKPSVPVPPKEEIPQGESGG